VSAGIWLVVSPRTSVAVSAPSCVSFNAVIPATLIAPTCDELREAMSVVVSEDMMVDDKALI
jgi:hypothetical protein